MGVWPVMELSYGGVALMELSYGGVACDGAVVWQVKDKEGELKSAEQKLHDEFERLRRQNSEEKRLLDDKKRQLVSSFDHFNLVLCVVT